LVEEAACEAALVFHPDPVMGNPSGPHSE
jgi:hypothetical protein